MPAFMDSPVNKRTFFLMVDPTLVPFSLSTPQPVKGYKPIKTAQGYYVNVGMRFGTGKKGNLPVNENAQLQEKRYTQLNVAIEEINRVIVSYILEECTLLIQYWYSHLDAYFNRSSHGRYYPSKIRGFRKVKNIPSTSVYKKPPHAMSTKTGQLKRALHVESVNFMGARLFVYPCYSHGNYADVDYVTFLIMGAPLTMGNHYVPSLNKRIKGGMWGGITAAYWTRWQKVFNKQVKISQDRLNRRVKLYMDTFMRTRENQVLFNPQFMATKSKQREYKSYKAVDENRFNVNVKASDMFDEESEYSNYFTSPVNTSQKGEYYFLGTRGSQILGNKSEHLAGQVYNPRKFR